LVIPHSGRRSHFSHFVLTVEEECIQALDHDGIVVETTEHRLAEVQVTDLQERLLRNRVRASSDRFPV
jgi:hypothetical protein